MIEYTGISRETYPRILGKQMCPAISVVPGKVLDGLSLDVEAALLATGKFKVIDKNTTKKTKKMVVDDNDTRIKKIEIAETKPIKKEDTNDNSNGL